MTRWDRRQGLPLNGIEGLAQTADGTLWIATAAGLGRFDGRRFTVYATREHPALPSDDVRNLAAAGETLWIGTSAGLARLEDGVIRAVPGAPADFVKHLLVDHGGKVWIATPTRLLREEGKTFVPVPSPEGKPVVSANMVEAADGAIWIHSSGTFWRWKDGAMALVQRGRPTPRLLGDPDGSVWAAGDDVLVHFQEGAQESVPLPPDQTMAIARDQSGSIWLASGLGLTRRTPAGSIETLKAETFGSLPSRLLVDREGSLWIGTETNGLFRLRDSEVVPWSLPEGLPSRAAYGFFEDQDGGVWITSEKGVTRISKKGVDAPLGLLSRPIVLVHAEGGRLWLATGKGLLLHKGGSDRRILDALVTGMASRGDGLWAATQRGLAHFKDGTLVAIYGTQEGAPTNVFLSLRLARDGAIWVGYEEGACRFADGRFHCFGPEDGGPHATVYFIHEDAAGDIWLGTNEGGLYRVHQGRFTRFTKAQGLPSDSHYAVLEDDRGHLWTSSAIGIARIEKASLDSGRARVRLYTEREGMRTSDCIGGGESALRTRDGKLWFATSEGAVMLDPSLPDPPPPVIATRIETRTQDARGWITIRYAAPTLAFGDAVTFRHQLMRFDTDWVATDESMATYTNVPPGNYRFLAQARVPPGPWGPSSEAAILVPARWWQTSVFRIAAAAGLLLLAFGFHRLRLARLLRLKQRLEAVVDARTRDLESRTQELAQTNATLEERVQQAVISLRESERMAAYGTLVAGVAHEVRQPIFALGTTAYVLQQRLSDRPDVAPELALVTRESKRVNRIMDELLEFARPADLQKTRVSPEALLREAADVFHAEHDPHSAIRVSVEAARSEEAFLDEARIVQAVVNLMGNARKHAAGVTHIGLRADQVDGRLQLSVENDGAGIPPEHLPRLFEPFYGAGARKGTGLGLAIVRRLAELHGGQVRVDSGATGTRFTLDLPMREA